MSKVVEQVVKKVTRKMSMPWITQKFLLAYAVGLPGYFHLLRTLASCWNNKSSDVMRRIKREVKRPAAAGN